MPCRYEATASISASVRRDVIVRIMEPGSVARSPDL